MATTLGADLRALRKSRAMTLEELAQNMARSVGWLSQVERGISKPSLSDIQRMAGIFSVPMSLFFGTADAPESERGRIVRGGARRTIGERESGLVEELLSPDLTDAFEVVHSTFLPGAGRTEAIRRPTQELAYLVSGKLDIWLGDEGGEEGFVVKAGDAFRIRDTTFRWTNPYPDPAVAIWVISPPVY